MTTEQTHDLDVDRTRIVTALVDLQAEAADLNARIEVLKAELRDLPAGDFAINGRPALRITPNRRFDPAKGLELVPEPLRAGCYSNVLDPAKVKSYLAPALVDLAMIEVGKPRVTIL